MLNQLPDENSSQVKWLTEQLLLRHVPEQSAVGFSLRLPMARNLSLVLDFLRRQKFRVILVENENPVEFAVANSLEEEKKDRQNEFQSKCNFNEPKHIAVKRLSIGIAIARPQPCTGRRVNR